MSIRRCSPEDEDRMLYIINQAAKAYRGVIPEDRYNELYMSREELHRETEKITFFGYEQNGELVGIMGFQPMDKETTLIRHAYVLPSHQRKGIGEKLLKHLMSLAETPEILVGTWEDATWAIRFYEKYGFKLVTREEKDRLLRKYWDIPERQIQTSLVLGMRKDF